MARPISVTPVLEDKDAERFDQAMKESEKKVISQEEIDRMLKNFEKFKNITSR